MNALGPGLVLGLCAALLGGAALVGRDRRSVLVALGSLIAIGASLFAQGAAAAYGAAAAAIAVHALAAWPSRRAAILCLGLGAALAGGAAALFARGDAATAFWLSCAALGLSAGVVPLHAGVAELCEEAPVSQSQLFGAVIALTFAHVRFAAPLPLAHEVAPTLVIIGAAAALATALMALVQRDLRGFYRCAVLMHGGMLASAVGAAGRGHAAAALLVAITVALALGGLGLMAFALEDRVGRVELSQLGGRVRSFPRLAAAFAIFGGAGVGLPGTAGFIADDFLLHALWGESPLATGLVIAASALLALATLSTYSRVFLGRQTRSMAPDLLPRERAVVVGLLALLVGVGLVPGALLGPLERLLTLGAT